MPNVRLRGSLLKCTRRAVLFRDSVTQQEVFLPLSRIVSWGEISDIFPRDVSSLEADPTMRDSMIWLEIPEWLARREFLV